MSLKQTVIKISETLYQHTNVLKKGYQPRANLVKDENDDLLVDYDNILNGWKNYFFQLFSVCGIHDVRQTEVHTDEMMLKLLLKG